MTLTLWRKPERFEHVNAWHEARALTRTLYQLTDGFPRDARFEVTTQIRRATTSIMCNIAEGARRETARDYAHFINMAEGSTAEVKSLVIQSGDVGYLTQAQVDELCPRLDQLLSMLYHLRVKIEQPSSPERASAPAQAPGRPASGSAPTAA